MLGLVLLLIAVAMWSAAQRDAAESVPAGVVDDVARVLATRDPNQYDAMARRLDAAGFRRSAASLRSEAIALRATLLSSSPEARNTSAEPVPAGPIGPPPRATCPRPMQDGHLVLVPGCKYRARLKLFGAQCFGSNQDIADYFRKMGFHDVRVFRRESDLPADWPRSERYTSTGPFTCARYAEGIWGASAKTIPITDVVQSMWLVR